MELLHRRKVPLRKLLFVAQKLGPSWLWSYCSWI